MKYIYLTLAFLCLICGSVGIVIPGLPTTPLLLQLRFSLPKALTDSTVGFWEQNCTTNIWNLLYNTKQ